MRKIDADVSLAAVGSWSYYVYRYEESLNDIENAVAQISYPKDAFHVPKALRAFISTDVFLSTERFWTNMWNGGQRRYFFVNQKQTGI